MIKMLPKIKTPAGRHPRQNPRR